MTGSTVTRGIHEIPDPGDAGEYRLHPRPVRLLLVEDNPADVRLVQEGFRAADVKPSLNVAYDGAQALAYLRREGAYEAAQRPDLIFLDLNLPKVSGREVLQAIKTDPELRRIPVIVWTTSKSERDVSAAYDLQANCYVTKPSDLDAFFRVIDMAQHFWFDIAVLPPRR